MDTLVENSEARTVEQNVRDRYAAGAHQVEPELCCPVDYDSKYLKILPDEILEKDYGCGDPSAYVHGGDTVLDLGSGAGKICYILSQKVGVSGRVIGVDFNDTMLALARKYQDDMADRIGYANVEFRKGKIQDLALDLDLLQSWMESHPVDSVEGLDELNAECDRLRAERPLVASHSVDAVVSNCVLNLVRTEQKQKLFKEIFRVLKRGGRAVISDIVCDEEPPIEMQNDPHLWSGCISGAFREDRFLEMFEEAGFHGIQILKRQEEPWHVIDGIEFRSITVRAYKGKQGPCLERNQAVVYKGPWSVVRDDDGHVYYRGKRMATCDKTYRLLTDPSGPYAADMIGIEPYDDIPLDDAEQFNCKKAAVRHPRQTKGEDYHPTDLNLNDICEDGHCC